MYWLADQEFSHKVPLVWERTAKDPSAPGDGEAERMVIADAEWRQKGQTHYLTFADPAGGNSDSADGKSAVGRIVLRVLPDRIVLTRFGDVTWNHTFAKGLTGQSTLRTAGFALDVQAETRELDIRIGPEGGIVCLAYRMTLGGAGGVVQDVRLQLRFGETAKAESVNNEKERE
jgi:uncharacterized beta-barrel protein YwiB (DUF1934 family)